MNLSNILRLSENFLFLQILEDHSNISALLYYWRENKNSEFRIFRKENWVCKVLEVEFSIVRKCNKEIVWNFLFRITHWGTGMVTAERLSQNILRKTTCFSSIFNYFSKKFWRSINKIIYFQMLKWLKNICI